MSDPVQLWCHSVCSGWLCSFNSLKFGSVRFAKVLLHTVWFVWLESVQSDYFRSIYSLYNSVRSWSPCPVRIETVPQCRRCLKWLTKNEHWSHFELESAPFLALVLKKIPGLSKHELVDAKWIWTGVGKSRMCNRCVAVLVGDFYFCFVLLKGMRRASICKRLQAQSFDELVFTIWLSADFLGGRLFTLSPGLSG